MFNKTLMVSRLKEQALPQATLHNPFNAGPIFPFKLQMSQTKREVGELWKSSVWEGN